ncbi:hypothetical protein GALMADRAFT_154675 [Galerina marginata CBS 339.88]|uniref:Uncharacterized protein n=1 Tax=Galerina marginata (strain CBS 339.88) TaxID=685588 RepID=A0A067T8P0_GALM3|nr:hypothetical protein GALMADRAFT_154675 [Galerina marginata CBS 339.88]
MLDPHDRRTVQSWKAWLQADINDDKAIIDTVNALITVAAFIAGVQAQVISFTIPLPRDVLGRTTNFFAVVGLILDIAGTFLGVIHALLIQRRMRYKSGLYDDIEQLVRNQDDDNVKMEAERILNALTRYIGKQPPLLRVRYTEPLFKVVFSFGSIPLLAMGFGVLFLLITILLFSVPTFGREVIIGCGYALAGVVGLSFFPLWYARYTKRRLRRNPSESRRILASD